MNITADINDIRTYQKEYYRKHKKEVGKRRRKYLDDLPPWEKTYYHVRQRCKYDKDCLYYKNGIILL